MSDVFTHFVLSIIPVLLSKYEENNAIEVLHLKNIAVGSPEMSVYETKSVFLKTRTPN